MTTSTRHIDRSFPLSGPIRLHVRFGYGSVTVRARDDLAEARVVLTARDADSAVLDRTTVELRGSSLDVTMPRQGALPDLVAGWRRERDAVDAEIDVPSGTAMKITTAAAPITVSGRSGSADLATGASDIDVEHVDGDLRIRTGSAATQIGTVGGAATVRTGSGDVRVAHAVGAFTAGFGSGDLDIEVADGSVRSRAGAGNARVGAAFGDVDLSAGAGGIGVGLPAGVAARLDVTSGSGRVHSDLPIEDEPVKAHRSITVRARTGSGSVRLFRAQLGQ